MKTKPDDQGNFIMVEDKGRLIRVFLYLSAIKRKKLLGEIDSMKGIMYMSRKKEKHLFRKGDAYGFNHFLLMIVTGKQI